MAMAPMPMGDEQESAPAQAAPAKPSELAVKIHSDMMQFMDFLRQGAKAVGPEAAQKMGSIVAAFQDLVTNDLGQAPGAPKPEPKAAPGSVPPEAAANPNARPM